MKKFITFGSIESFYKTEKDLKKDITFIGLNKDGYPLFDKYKRLPKIKVVCSEKIHGTNASVCYNNKDGFWTQSRKNIITPEKDNAGFSDFAYSKKEIFIEMMKELAKEYSINLDKETISIYMEWCGGNIQKKTAVQGLDKRAIIFQYFKITDNENNDINYWKESSTQGHWVEDRIHNIFNIMNFPFYEFNIDFNNTNIYKDKLIDLVEGKIENSSPVGEQFGIKGNIGEGVVCQFLYNDKLYRFKVKGEKHTNTKVKKLKKIDNEANKIKIEIANKVCSPGRLEQAWQNTFGIENEKEIPNIKRMGDFLRIVIADVVKEEGDLMKEKGVSIKDLGKYISEVSKKWFIEQLNNNF